MLSYHVRARRHTPWYSIDAVIWYDRHTINGCKIMGVLYSILR